MSIILNITFDLSIVDALPLHYFGHFLVDFNDIFTHDDTVGYILFIG